MRHLIDDIARGPDEHGLVIGRPPAIYAVLYMAATRTQVYFTREQREQLDARARREGKTLAQVVRDAVHAYVAPQAPDPRVALNATFGALPDLDVPARDEWTRG